VYVVVGSSTPVVRVNAVSDVVVFEELAAITSTLA
jgi:hypothetical protein